MPDLSLQGAWIAMKDMGIDADFDAGQRAWKSSAPAGVPAGAQELKSGIAALAGKLPALAVFLGDDVLFVVALDLALDVVPVQLLAGLHDEVAELHHLGEGARVGEVGAGLGAVLDGVEPILGVVLVRDARDEIGRAHV